VARAVRRVPPEAALHSGSGDLRGGKPSCREEGVAWRAKSERGFDLFDGRTNRASLALEPAATKPDKWGALAA